MAIYTKKGDKGTTSLYSSQPATSQRISKDSIRIRTIGSIDELDSFLGLAKSFCLDLKIQKIISDIQRDLLTIGSCLAGSKLRFSKTKTKKLEKMIDVWEGNLPRLSHFILPGGTPLSAQLHVSRSMARRAEREVTALSEVEKVPDSIKIYMNRLSDFLFMLARLTNSDQKIKEEIWVGKKK
ncbi:MAG TPA: cob(I)yrinic acid a,c-diamide adenosyltransferase [Patescibacteria group bacterium]